MRNQVTNTSEPRVRSIHDAPRAAHRRSNDRARIAALESVLRAAAQIAKPYPEEAEAIERVIQFVRGNGPAGEVPIADILLALSILLTANDRDPPPEERAMLAMLDAVLRAVGAQGQPRAPSAGPEHGASAGAPRGPRSLARADAPTRSPHTSSIPTTPHCLAA